VVIGCRRDTSTEDIFPVCSDSKSLYPRAPSLALPFTLSAGLACAKLKNHIMAMSKWQKKEENDESMIAKAAFKR